MVKKILEEQPVSITKVEDIIKERKKDGELTYEQKKTLQYTKEFKKLDTKEAEELLNELEEAKIDEQTAVKIVDVLPRNKTELKVLYSKHHIPTEEETSMAVELVKKHGKD